MDVGVVYQIPCNDCNLSYFGQSGRGFDVRLTEHKNAVRLRRVNNACYKHISDKNHSLNWENARVVYKSNILSNRLVVESSLIVARPNYNNSRSTLTIENLAANLIINSQTNFPPPD